MNIKDQFQFNTEKSIMRDIKSTQEAVRRACKKLWRESDNILEQFAMDTMSDLEEETPTELKIEDV
jgi:hypothetical protein